MNVVFLDKDLNPTKQIPEYPNNQLVKYYSLENALLALPCDIKNEVAKCINIWFSNPTKWKDPYETCFLNNSKYGNRILAQSYTSNRASEAQWIAYSKDELSLQFSFDWTVLLKSLQESKEKCTAYIGNVQYLTINEIRDRVAAYSKLKGPESLVKQLFLKRLPYSYEEEIRIVLVYDKDLEAKYAEGKIIENFPMSLLNRITICPQAKEETTILLKKALKKRSKCDEVYKSQLYKQVEKI